MITVRFLVVWGTIDSHFKGLISVETALSSAAHAFAVSSLRGTGVSLASTPKENSWVLPALQTSYVSRVLLDPLRVGHLGKAFLCVSFSAVKPTGSCEGGSNG